MPSRHFLLGLICGALLCVLLAGAFLVYAQTRPVASPRLPGGSGSEHLRITVDEVLLSEMVTAAIREQDSSMDKVVVDLRSGGWLDVILGAKVSLAGQTADLQLKLIGTLSIDGRRLVLSIAQMELAGMPISVDLLPASLQKQMNQLVNDANEQLAETLAETGFAVLSARTDESTLSVSLGLAER